MRPWVRNLFTTVALAVALATASAARADRVRTVKGIGVDGEITGLTPDGLVIQSNEIKKTIPFAEVARVEAAKYPELAKAEDAYNQGVQGKAGAFADAEKLYRSVLKEGVPQWLKVWVQYRMYKLYADARRVPEALDAYLDMAKASPKLVEGLKLPTPLDEAHEANQAMLKKVDEAIKAAGSHPYAGELKSFRVGLVMLEGKPEEALPLLAPLLASTDPKVRQPAMLKEIELLMAMGKTADAGERLKQAGPALAEAYPAEVAYWEGRVLQEEKKYVEAALAYMRLPILYPNKDRNRTADALCRAGQSLREAKAPAAEVVKLFTEAVQQYSGTPAAERARKELATMSQK